MLTAACQARSAEPDITRARAKSEGDDAKGLLLLK